MPRLMLFVPPLPYLFHCLLSHLLHHRSSPYSFPSLLSPLPFSLHYPLVSPLSILVLLAPRLSPLTPSIARYLTVSASPLPSNLLTTPHLPSTTLLSLFLTSSPAATSSQQPLTTLPYLVRHFRPSDHAHRTPPRYRSRTSCTSSEAELARIATI